MRTVVKQLFSLCGAAVLVLLITTGSVAQKTSAPGKRQCAWETSLPSAQPQSSRTVSQSGKAYVDLSYIESRITRANCEVLTLEFQRTKVVNTDLKYLFDATPQFTLESFSHSNVVTESDSVKGTTKSQEQAASEIEAQELAKKLSNPVASLISVPLQSSFDFGMGTGSGWRYTLNVQPVIPMKLSDKWNLISRTIVPIIHQGNVTGPQTSQSGLGDTVQSFFFSPSKTEPFIWAVGPVALIPTATDRNLGTQKWGLGPTALILKQNHGWTYGVLANHIWSVAGKSNRSEVDSTFIQPFLSYTDKQAWTYALNTESTYDWSGNSWAVPIHAQLSKLVRFGKQPVSFGGAMRCWVTSPAGGPEGCGFRIIVTALFPKG